MTLDNPNRMRFYDIEIRPGLDYPPVGFPFLSNYARSILISANHQYTLKETRRLQAVAREKVGHDHMDEFDDYNDWLEFLFSTYS